MVYRIIWQSIKSWLPSHFFQTKILGRKIDKTPSPPHHLSDIPSITTSQLQQFAQRYEGKLLRSEEIPLPKNILNKLITYHYFRTTPSINRTLLSYQCTRCFNKERGLLAHINCRRCGREHLYCRSCIEMGRILQCSPLYYWAGISYLWPKHHAPSSFKGQLTPPQVNAANRIVSSVEQSTRLLVWAVTGSGKTEMLFPGITKALILGMRIGLATPRADVVRELLPRLRDAFDSVTIQGLYAGSRDKDGTAQIIISTTHQLMRFRHAFDVLIIDEIDAFPYHSDPTLQMAANRAKKNHAAVIYLTATPREKQQRQISTGILDFVFVPVRFHGQPLVLPKWVRIPGLKKSIHKGKIPKPILDTIEQLQKSPRQLLIFIPTIADVHLFYPILKMYIKRIPYPSTNLQIDYVFAADPNRKEKVEAFREKRTHILLTTTILERGVTFPSVDVMVYHADHPNFDEAALVQIAGRVGRSIKDPYGNVIFYYEAKTDAMVKANDAIHKMNQLQKKPPI